LIYVCIPSYNEAPTVGLLLWKIRQVFSSFEREYQLIVGDDGSTDSTGEVLQPYTRVLPLSVIRKPARAGYARMCEDLLAQAVERTDRPKRDCAILMHADFGHDPGCIPEMVRRIDGGADLVVAEAATSSSEASRSFRLVRRWAPLLLRGRVNVPGVQDVVSGLMAVRLITLRNMFRESPPPLLRTDGWAARAELLGRAARHSRRTESVRIVERNDLRQRERRETPWQTIREVWRQRGALALPPARPAPLERDAELVS
jgi:glycosyltransferase involved in cell wall biosynthesis